MAAEAFLPGQKSAWTTWNWHICPGPHSGWARPLGMEPLPSCAHDPEEGEGAETQWCQQAPSHHERLVWVWPGSLKEPLAARGPSAPLSLRPLTAVSVPSSSTSQSPPSLSPRLLSALSLIFSFLIKAFLLSELPIPSLSPGVGIKKELLHFLSGCPSPLGLD